MTCGKDPSEADVDFWDMVVKCNTRKKIASRQQRTGSCTWCKIEQKVCSYGNRSVFCFSTEFYHALREQDNDGVLSEFMQCTTDSTDTLLRAGSLTDTTCILEGRMTLCGQVNRRRCVARLWMPKDGPASSLQSW